MNLKRLSVCVCLGLTSVSGLADEAKVNRVVLEEESVDGISKAVIVRLKALPAIVGEIKDEASGEAATKKIGVLSGELLELSERLSKLEEPSEEEKVAISKRFEAQLNDTNTEMIKAMEKLMDKPELIKMVTLVMQDFGKKSAKAGQVFEKYFEPRG